MNIGFIRAGLAIFAVLGVLHLIYTLMDLRVPKYFAPRDRKVIAFMQQTHVALAKNPKNYWESYLGFNLSHSLGILVFVATYSVLSVIAPEIIFHPAMSFLLIGTGGIFAFLAYRFWFSIPLIGSLCGTFLFVISTVIHWGT